MKENRKMVNKIPVEEVNKRINSRQKYFQRQTYIQTIRDQMSDNTKHAKLQI